MTVKPAIILGKESKIQAKELKMTEQRIDVHQIARESTARIAECLLDADDSSVFPLEYDKDMTAVLVSANGTHVKLVPRYDRIRHARIDVYTGCETTRPELDDKFYVSPFTTIFTEVVSDDPLAEFDGMTDAIIDTLRRAFTDTFTIESQLASHACPPKRKTAYDTDALCRELIVPERYTFDDFADRSRTKPIIYRTRTDGRTGATTTDYIMLETDKLSDWERRDKDVACISTNESTVKPDGETTERPAFDYKIWRTGRRGTLPPEWVCDAVNIIDAFADTDFDVIKVNYRHTDITVRHPEYGDFSIYRISDHDGEFTGQCDDLHTGFRIGIYEGEDFEEELFEREYDGSITSREAESLYQAELQRRFRALPETIKKCFEENVVAVMAERHAGKFDNAAHFEPTTDKGCEIGNYGVYEDDIDVEPVVISKYPNEMCWETCRVDDTVTTDRSHTVVYDKRYTSDGGKTFRRETYVTRRIIEQA